MKQTLKVIVSIAFLLASLFVLVTLVVRNLPDVREAREFGEKFALVQIGDSENRVLSLLGSPDSKEKKFRIGQREGFEEAYARAAASDSKYYLLWFRGFDVVFTVGFNDKGQVTVKESGGT
jgi:hypothetical protein